MFLKKKKQNNDQSKIIIGMIMLQDEHSFDLNALITCLSNDYNKTVDDISGDTATVAFSIDNELVAVAHMPAPIPNEDIEATAAYAYNWQNAVEDLKSHKSHLIVSLIKGGSNQIKRFKIFTQVLCALLTNTNALGVYKGTQSLLIPKEDYLNAAAVMSDEHLPLNLWVYFGLRITDNGNSGYTYGLKAFNKHEMEILDSSKSLEEIRRFLFDTTHYILNRDIIFKHGQTCCMSNEESIAITFSKGKFVKGETLKLAY